MKSIIKIACFSVCDDFSYLIATKYEEDDDFYVMTNI